MMSTSTWIDADTAKAIQIWAEYKHRHDITAQHGQTAGIDPVTGRVWFGDSAADIWRQLEAAGIDTPLYHVRVGLDYYVRKGGRR
jgi:hypothetical protein